MKMMIPDVHTSSVPETRIGIIDEVIGEPFYRALWDARGFVEENLVCAGTYSKLWNELFLLAGEVLDESGL